MFRFICLVIPSVILVGLSPDLAIAQPGGERRSSKFMSFIDRNKNGVIEPAEFDQMPGRMKESLEAAGVDTSRSMTRQEFERMAEQMRSRRRERSDTEGRGRPTVMRVSPDSNFGSTGSTNQVIVNGVVQKPTQVHYGTIQSKKSDKRATSTTAKSSSSSKKVSVKPVRTTVDLNEEFTPHDLDQDGQIGLYEWRKNNPSKLAVFFVIDLNGDGFLTPREIQLFNAGKTQRSAASFMFALNSDLPADSKQTETTTKPTPSNKVVNQKSLTPASAKKTSTASTDPVTNQANVFFKLLDRNKDGTISPEEWKKSRSMRRMFEGANIDLTQSMSQAQFVVHFVTIKKK